MGILFRKKKVGADYYLERGEECLKNENYPWAIESFTRALEFDSQLELAYYGRAEAYKKGGKEKEAVWDYIKFLEFDRRGPEGAQDSLEAVKEAISYAGVLMQRGSVKSSITSFGIPKILDEMIREYTPNQEYADRHFYDLALSWFDKNFSKDSYYIGFIRLLRKEYDEALKHFEKALGKGEENPSLYYLQGVALMKRNRERGASQLIDATSIEREEIQAFSEALRKGYEGKICSGCGYRTSSRVNFCSLCGEKLLG